MLLRKFNLSHGLIDTESDQKHKVIYISLIALALFRLVHQSFKFLLEKEFIDLAHHYFYSSMIRMGLNPFDERSVQIAESLIPLRIAGGTPANTPTLTFFYQPLTHIPFSILPTLWLLLSLLLVFSAIYLFLKRQEWDRSWPILTFVVLIVATYQPLFEDLALGQNNTHLLFLSFLVWYGIRKKNHWITGIALGIMPIIKIHYLFLTGFLLLLRSYRTFLISSVSFVVLFFCALPQVGFSFYSKYVEVLTGHVSYVSTHIRNISFSGQIHRILGNDSSQATILHIVISLIVVFLIVQWFYKNRINVGSGYVFLIGLILVPLLSPHTEEHHLIPILLPLIFAGLHICDARPSTQWLFLATVVLLVSRYSWISFLGGGNVSMNTLLSLKSIGVLTLLIVMIRLRPIVQPGLPLSRQ